MLVDKYNLTRQQSIFLAKKRWDENVYCGMRMENRAVTFPQTKTILSGVNVPEVSLCDIQAILNMRDAWRYLLETLDGSVTLEYALALNGAISRNESLEWGVLRTGKVGISGTDYVSDIPDEKKVRGELEGLLSYPYSVTERALDIFLWGTWSQLFWDGNKRTSLMLANKLLISEGKGILTITDRHMNEFNMLLLDYYDRGIGVRLKEFLYENCIQGIDFN